MTSADQEQAGSGERFIAHRGEPACSQGYCAACLTAELARAREQIENLAGALVKSEADLERVTAERTSLRTVLSGYVTGCHACGGDPMIKTHGYPPIYECRECLPARQALAALDATRKATGEQG